MEGVERRIIPIRELSIKELDVYARMSEGQLLNREHPEEGIFIAESPKVIQRALDGGYEPISFLMEDKHIMGEGAEILARCPTVPVYAGPFDVLTQLTGFQLTRGMLCAMRRKPLLQVRELCRNARRIAVLEGVMNPTNVGAIFRSAAAFNIDGVLLSLNCANPLYRRAIRVSMGTVFQIPWTYDPEWPHSTTLKELGFKTVAMALREDSVSLCDPRLRAEERLAIIMGTEGDGLGDLTIGESDYTVKIPMSHGVDSLNVAAAAAVAFWELAGKI